MPYVEALYTTVNFTLPDFEIDASVTPPKPDESNPEPRYLSNLAKAMSMNCFGMAALNAYATIDASLDAFFKALALGKDGVPMGELVGLANVDRLIHRMSRVYGQTMAQEINANYRVPLSPANGTAASLAATDMLDSLSGTVVVNRQRLVQSPIATRILEGVLLAMALCAGLHFWLTPETRILPKDPGSVAAKMSLFAGSKLVRRIPENNEELRGAFQGGVVSLGWWDGGEEGGSGSGTREERRFGIDVGMAEKT
ncbi:hypothetical protein UCRNP2_5292 [Neofusicoccum parvum UCRNP2]|uniref:Uncharacterized protein n=1 Tax=Botryosphaeria parva (strain UCR-NP2) TaxID=1287680 RepID=R1EJL1_BOTPV|nr:hypothetical protein UCRNP2_5292 [Neofusicoccum parvum UCRNP2]